MGKIDVVQWGPDRLRIGPWRGDRAVAVITPAPGQAPASAAIDRCLHILASRGYRSALTSALTYGEQQTFLANSFTVYERLHLLHHSLRELPERPSSPGDPRARLRRGRRRDRAAVLDVDGAAFDPFWRFDANGLDDARSATPSSRFRVAEDPSVVGYAVTGRAGPTGYLQRLAVRPDRQGRGIGTALVVDGLDWARRHGATSMLVNTQESNRAALALYEDLGFTREPYGLAVLERPLTGLEASA